MKSLVGVSLGKTPLPGDRQTRALGADAECRELQAISGESPNRRALTGTPESVTADTVGNQAANATGTGMEVPSKENATKTTADLVTLRDAEISGEDVKLSEMQETEGNPLYDTLEKDCAHGSHAGGQRGGGSPSWDSYPP